MSASCTCYRSGRGSYRLQVLIIAYIWSYVHSAELTLAHSTTGAAPGSTVSSSECDANNLAATCTTDTNLGSSRSPSLLGYTHYMSRLLASEEWTPVSSPAGSSTETSPTFRGKVSPAFKLRLELQLNRTKPKCFPPAFHTQCTCEPAEPPRMSHATWANALIGRIFWDFLREKHWSDVVSHKIQKKLSRIRVRRAVAAQ